MSRKSFALCAASLLCLSLIVTVGCGGGDSDNNTPLDGDNDTVAENGEGTESESCGDGVICAKKEKMGRWTVVWLEGTPYEMGYQHGELLHEELKGGLEYVNADPFLSSMKDVAENMGIIEIAEQNSYPEILDECQGLADAAGDIGWTKDYCLMLNFGDVMMEYINDGMPEADSKKLQPGCTEIAAMGDATADGRLYHARILDWAKIDYILQFPTLLVRQPKDGLKHVYIGFPGNLSPYSGMNEMGISIASNEAHPLDINGTALSGRSHVQLVAHLLANASTMDDVKDIIGDTIHMSTELLMITDGKTQEAAVFEMTAGHVGIREPEGGLLYATNHFLAPETEGLDLDPTKDANLLRYDRLTELLAPQGSDETHYGEISPEVLISTMRDRVNPWTDEESDVSEFDNGLSLATYGALYQIVFDPERLFFWVAAGELPVPQQTFVGFSLGDLLDLPDAEAVEPTQYE